MLKKKGQAIVLVQYPDTFMSHEYNLVQNVRCTFSWVYCTLVFSFLSADSACEVDDLYCVLMLGQQEMMRNFFQFMNIHKEFKLI